MEKRLTSVVGVCASPPENSHFLSKKKRAAICPSHENIIEDDMEPT